MQVDIPKLIRCCNMHGVMDPDPQREGRFIFKVPWGHFGAPTRIQAGLFGLINKPTFWTDISPPPLKPSDRPQDASKDVMGMCVHPTSGGGVYKDALAHYTPMKGSREPIDMEAPRDAFKPVQTITPKNNELDNN